MLAHGKFYLKWPKWGQELFFLLIQTLPTFWAERILSFNNFILGFFGSNISRFPGPRFPNLQKSGLGQAWPGLGLGRGGSLGWALGCTRVHSGARVAQIEGPGFCDVVELICLYPSSSMMSTTYDRRSGRIACFCAG